MPPSSAQAGFTLIEILVVLAVIGLLAAVLIPNVLGARVSSQRSVAQTFMHTCVAAAEQKRNFLDNTLPHLSTCQTLGLSLPKGVIRADFSYTSYDPNADAILTVTFQGRTAPEVLTATLPFKPASS